MDLHVALLFVKLVLEDLSVHDVFVLVDQGTHALRRSLVFVLDDVESLTSICVNRRGQHEFEELSLRHLVDLCVNIHLDLKSIDDTRRSNTGH